MAQTLATIYITVLVFSLFVFGLAIGSFLNVVSIRYSGDSPRGGEFRLSTLRGRSQCPHCGQILRWYELIPIVSFVIQKGKCRSCGQHLSFQYPVVELGTAIVFTALFLYFIPSLTEGFLSYLQFGIWILAASVFILIAAIDARLFIIPDGMTVIIAICGTALTALQDSYINHISAALFGILFFGLVVLMTKGQGMGMGDVKLAGAIGLMLGFANTVLAFASAFVIGALWGLGLIILKRKTLKDAVPFGPFLVMGVFLSIMITPWLLNVLLLN